MHSSWKDLRGRVISRLRRLSTRLRGSANGKAVSRGGATGQADLRDDLGGGGFPDYQLAMLQAHHHAINDYTPKPIEGRIFLFRPRTAPLFGPWTRRSYDRTWHDVARGGVEAHEIRGSHITMLIEPYAAELAVHLNRAIDNVERRPVTTVRQTRRSPAARARV